MKRRTRTKAGDIVAIPIGGQWAHCQVLVKRDVLYVGVFAGLRSTPEGFEFNPPARFILTGWTMDAKISRGDWLVLDNFPEVDLDHWKRNYLVGYDGQTWVEDFDGRLEHVATFEENASLFLRSSYSPARLERVIRAINSLEKWDSEFSDLLVC